MFFSVMRLASCLIHSIITGTMTFVAVRIFQQKSIRFLHFSNDQYRARIEFFVNEISHKMRVGVRWCFLFLWLCTHLYILNIVVLILRLLSVILPYWLAADSICSFLVWLESMFVPWSSRQISHKNEHLPRHIHFSSRTHRRRNQQVNK